MKWTVKLVMEREGAVPAERSLVSWERPDALKLEDIGTTLAEGKRLLTAVQEAVVVAQMERHGAIYAD